MKRWGFWPCAVAGILFLASEPSLAYYHPTAGRWVARDKDPPARSRNLYEYGFCRPVLLVDPEGNAPFLPPISQTEQPAHRPSPIENTPTEGGLSIEEYLSKPQQPSKPAPTLDSTMQSFVDEAEKRRGRGPLGDSAQHCWAACYIGAVFGMPAGQLAAVAEDIPDLRGQTGDWQRDIQAQHYGALCPFLSPFLFGLFPDEMCDCCALPLRNPDSLGPEL